MYSENNKIPKKSYYIDEIDNNKSQAIILENRNLKNKNFFNFTGVEKEIINLIEEDSLSLYDQIPESTKKKNESFSRIEKIDVNNKKSNDEKSVNISNF